MITIDTLIVTVDGLDRAEVEHWIAQDWIRPDTRQGTWLFHEIDVARLRLIQQLCHEFKLQDDAVPMILRLLDQLYDERRRLRHLRDVVERVAPSDLRLAMLAALLKDTED